MINKKRQVVFVDNDIFVLNGFQRSLEGYTAEWDVFYCVSAEEALTLLNREPIDALITNLRLTGFDGVALLEEVIQKYPSVMRFVMAGSIEEPQAFKAANLAHQLIIKPCDIQKIHSIVEEACILRDMLANKKLVKLVTGIKNLPSVPTLYVRLLKEFQSEQPTLRKVGEIISMDLAMTAKILQLVNSAFFSIPHTVSNLNQAISILGLNTIKALVLSVGIFTEYQTRSFSAFSIEELWQHSIFVGNLSRAIAVSVNLNQMEQDEAQTAGILHDVGKLIQSDLPGFYRLLTMNTKIPRLQMEYHYLGTSHVEIGAYMLSLWGLPSGVIKAAAFHHDPVKDTTYKADPVTAVYVANQLYYSENPSTKKKNSPPQMDMRYLEKINVDRKLDDWREMAKMIFAGEKPI